jgi:hypothetical protein
MSLKEEMSLVSKLLSLDLPCKTVFDGLTNRDERKEKVRAVVKTVRDKIYKVENGRNITMEQAFQRAYREEL